MLRILREEDSSRITAVEHVARGNVQGTYGVEIDTTVVPHSIGVSGPVGEANAATFKDTLTPPYSEAALSQAVSNLAREALAAYEATTSLPVQSTSGFDEQRNAGDRYGS